MKKYITIAALLAAGTTFANASSEELVVTFADKSASSISGILSDKDFGSVSIALERDSTSGDLYMTTANSGAAGKADAFTPNQKINDGDWTATFTFTVNNEVEFTFNKIDLNVIAFNSSGNNQESGDGVSRQVDFAISIMSDETEVAKGTIENLNITGGTYDKPMQVGIALDRLFTATDDFSIVITASVGTTNEGTYAGLKSFTLSSVPEPSAFGMLAGLGALALVASRRRRK